jgi:2-polyprenyl-3-methyl-5-hydroxy-6-metoxy-1,4-benzoquinol methylase
MGIPDKANRAIEYLSPPALVRMADHWFEIASLDHFWVRRRFAVLQRLAGRQILAARELAEVGCGHGLLQRQIEDTYGKEVWGFDLNESALRQNVSHRSKLCCYDIFQRDAALHGRFDTIFLFDVLEHISDESAFLQALLFHLFSTGSVVVNVPAGQWAHSSYDDAAGHVRRYSIHNLQGVMAANGLVLKQWTYWGLPLVPSLMIRKLWLFGKRDQSEIIAAGFDSRSSVVNRMMAFLSQLEWLPQKFLGTSLMAIFERANQGTLSSSAKTSGA